ncbi:MAG: hypothetical protein NC331_15835 [Lachnospiraceae bacterium]|nr:hypothetical protein [Lachnospiraceae bacterium]MCM1240760.1 hypothetical protein [Lachnospiraceae bacterium]MCM1240825.1 hypothetical protein [Lachnospiraceae bacterium]
MPFKEKSVRKVSEKCQKSAEKNIGKKVTKKTLMQYDAILSAMAQGIWYQAKDLSGVLDVKGNRLKTLLRELVAAQRLEEDGATKGKKYRKRDD